MSNDQAPGAPSFGDLFDDPDAPRGPGRDPAPADAPADGPVDSPVEASAPRCRTWRSTQTPDPELAADVAFSSPYTEGATDLDLAADEPLPEEPPAPSYVAPAAAAAAAPTPWDGTVDPAASSPAASPVNTGRLYRSAGAEGPATLEAIPAIDPSYVPRAAAVADARPPRARSRRLRSRAAVAGSTYSGVAVVVISVTVLVAFADALINDKLGIITGVALAVSSIYAASPCVAPTSGPRSSCRRSRSSSRRSPRASSRSTPPARCSSARRTCSSAPSRSTRPGSSAPPSCVW